MSDTSQEQQKRLSIMIDRIFPNLSGKERLMASVSDSGDYSRLAEMSDAEIEEMIAMEKEFLGI